MFTAIVRVAFLALAFGAGIPALFALGMRCLTGDPIRDENGVVVDDTPASAQMKALGMAVYAALAWSSSSQSCGSRVTASNTTSG